jgi:hypothetical protein
MGMTKAQCVTYAVTSAVALVPVAALAAYLSYVTWNHPNFSRIESLGVSGFVWGNFIWMTHTLWKHYRIARQSPGGLP